MADARFAGQSYDLGGVTQWLVVEPAHRRRAFHPCTDLPVLPDVAGDKTIGHLAYSHLVETIFAQRFIRRRGDGIGSRHAHAVHGHLQAEILAGAEER